MDKLPRALNFTSKATSLIATFSTIFPLKNKAVAWSGIGGATVSLVTKLAEEIIHQCHEDDNRNPCKSGINTVNRIALLTITCLESLPIIADDLFNENMDDTSLLSFRLALLSLWAATICFDFGIREERTNYRY